MTAYAHLEAAIEAAWEARDGLNPQSKGEAPEAVAATASGASPLLWGYRSLRASQAASMAVSSWAWAVIRRSP